MTREQLPWYIARLVVLILGIQAAMWFFIVRYWRRRVDAITAQIRASTQGETVVREPMRVNYSGATGGNYSKVGTMAVAALTDKRLILQRLRGEAIEFARGTLEGAREEKTFRTRISAGRTHVVLKLRDGVEVGFSLGTSQDPGGWVADIQRTLAG